MTTLTFEERVFSFYKTFTDVSQFKRPLTEDERDCLELEAIDQCCFQFNLEDIDVIAIIQRFLEPLDD